MKIKNPKAFEELRGLMKYVRQTEGREKLAEHIEFAVDCLSKGKLVQGCNPKVINFAIELERICK